MIESQIHHMMPVVKTAREKFGDQRIEIETKTRKTKDKEKILKDLK